MKFNEKLIELRRKEGLSQEELGYKLNVTRQTISKWELGQTTPEMDKIVEMSKIFNLSVDELINESETNPNQNAETESQPIKKQKTKINQKTVIIIVAILIVVILLTIGISAIMDKERNSVLDKFFGIFQKTTEVQENRASSIFDRATNIIDQVTEEQKNNSSMANEYANMLDQVTNTLNQIQ